MGVIWRKRAFFRECLKFIAFLHVFIVPDMRFITGCVTMRERERVGALKRNDKLGLGLSGKGTEANQMSAEC